MALFVLAGMGLFSRKVTRGLSSPSVQFMSLYFLITFVIALIIPGNERYHYAQIVLMAILAAYAPPLTERSG